MGYRPKKFTEAMLAVWQKEGRGTGEGAAYVPWLQAGDVPTHRGAMVRFKCAKTGRKGVCFSLIEDAHRQFYESKARVMSVDEQFPLDRERTRRIARQLGIDHPADPKTHVDIVMTTDLVVRARTDTGDPLVLPRGTKPTSGLNDFNDAEHAEIEKRYWAEDGYRWKFITDSHACMPSVLRENLDLLKPFRFELENQPWPGYWPWLLRRVAEMTQKNATSDRFDVWCATLDQKLGVSSDHSRHALSFLIHREIVRADLNSTPLQALGVSLLTVDIKRLSEDG